MKLIVTLSGEFSDELDDGDLVDLCNELNATARIEFGGSNVAVQVNRA